MHQGLVTETTDGYRVLKLNALSWEVLRQQRSVQVAIDPAASSASRTPADQDTTELDDITFGLFDRLRRLRKKLADERSVPPYVVFSDGSLRLMARLRPQTLDQFATISGVGRRKLDEYGAAFTGEISSYCQEHGLDAVMAVAEQRVALRSDRILTTTARQTLDLYQQGLKPSTIAEARGLRLSTILGHFEELLQKGESINLDDLIPLDRQAKIKTAIATVGSQRLKDIYVHLDEQFTYEEIRLVRAQQIAEF